MPRYEGRQNLPIRRCPSCRAYSDSMHPRAAHVPGVCKIEEAIASYGVTVQPALHQVRLASAMSPCGVGIHAYHPPFVPAASSLPLSSSALSP